MSNSAFEYQKSSYGIVYQRVPLVWHKLSLVNDLKFFFFLCATWFSTSPIPWNMVNKHQFKPNIILWQCHITSEERCWILLCYKIISQCWSMMLTAWDITHLWAMEMFGHYFLIIVITSCFLEIFQGASDWAPFIVEPCCFHL